MEKVSRMFFGWVAAAALAVAFGAHADGERAGAPSAAVGADGAVHWVQLADEGRRALYTSCAAGCVAGDEAEVAFELESPVSRAAIALGTDGKPRVLLGTRNRVFFGACEGDCSRREGWSLAVVAEHAGRFAPSEPSFAVASSGEVRFRLEPVNDGWIEGGTQAFVATCGRACLDSARWEVHLERNATGPAASAVAALP